MNQRKEYLKKWREKNRKKLRHYYQNYYKKHHKKKLEAQKRYRDRHKNRIEKRRKLKVEKLREEVFKHYSKGKIKCACCGEKVYEFLTIDHIKNDGWKQKKQGIDGNRLLAWIKRKNFPPSFQVLCYNCNCAKYRYGVCPHQKNGRGKS